MKGTAWRIATVLSILGLTSLWHGATAQVNSVFTIDAVKYGVTQGQVAQPPGHESYDLTVIRFEDNGKLSQTTQLDDAAEAITNARRTNPNGAIVVVFMHGWHHNDDWDTVNDQGDEHFKLFRQTLTFIALREAERPGSGFVGGGRRVVGVYLSWNGDPPDYVLARVPILTHGSFWDRYSTAKQIGEREDARKVLRTLVQVTKGPSPNNTAGGAAAIDSPLILIGHSMGALILQSAFLALLKDPSEPLVRPALRQFPMVEVRRNGSLVAFPDVLISMNSAADSRIHKEIRRTLQMQRFTKEVKDQRVSYALPLLISATSVDDNDTKYVWRAANAFYPSRTTDGHDATLFTHGFSLDRSPVACDARKWFRDDYGQNWHCLRTPEPPIGATPRIPIDLPLRDRTGRDDIPPFARYVLVPRDPRRPHLTWVFRLPPAIVPDHNNIFNSRASSLMLAMIQMSGAIASLAQDWGDTFEPYAP